MYSIELFSNINTRPWSLFLLFFVIYIHTYTWMVLYEEYTHDMNTRPLTLPSKSSRWMTIIYCLVDSSNIYSPYHTNTVFVDISLTKVIHLSIMFTEANCQEVKNESNCSEWKRTAFIIKLYHSSSTSLAETIIWFEIQLLVWLSLFILTESWVELFFWNHRLPSD